MGRISIEKNFCKGCSLCIDVCPFGLIRISGQINKKGYLPAEFIDPDKKCTGCTLCAITCPEAAIEVYKEKRSKKIAR